MVLADIANNLPVIIEDRIILKTANEIVNTDDDENCIRVGVVEQFQSFV